MEISNETVTVKSADEYSPEQIGTTDNNNTIFANVLRILTMLDKAVERLARRNYFNRKQYPQILSDIEYAFTVINQWC